MKIYLVGGAVRDRLMGRPVVDRDWVVVGGTPEALLAEGYQAVGAGFPVFLHPKTREEYALARTERRTGPGHKGFETWYAPDVTLEDDLRRRDLTINAIAMTPEGEYVDPYGGRQDLEARWLRAVSPAFVEDPLRVLRVARFAATLPGFSIHPDTLELMRHMVRDGLLDELPAERVWHELDKAVHGEAPDRFIDVIREIPAFEPWFPEWQSVTSVVVNNPFKGRERLALWCESLGPEAVRRLCARLKAPHPARDFLLHVEFAARHLLSWREASGDRLVEVLERTHAFHPDSEVEAVTSYLERRHGVDLDAFRHAAQLAAQVRAAEFKGVAGRELGEAIRRRRAGILDDQRRRL